MNDTYILEHVSRLMSLIYGKKKTFFAYKKGDYYYFGFERKDKKPLINKIDKSIAIYLIINKSLWQNGEKKKKKKVKRQRTKNPA